MSSIKSKKNLIWKYSLATFICLLFIYLFYSTPIQGTTASKQDIPSLNQKVIEVDNILCATPDGQPLTKYSVIIDAGSSGSRVHVYQFRVCNDPVMENEVFHMLEPGLSSYKDDPKKAAESLDKLMEIAVKNVPEQYQSCTPIAVKATAGLRLLGADKSDAILDSVVHRLETKYPFPIAGDQGVEIMDGKDEGVYAWVTVNYLLGKFKKSKRGQSAAVFDLGGASTQIVFEPTYVAENMPEGDHKYELNYQNDTYNLYQHSYLGYGLNEARKSVKLELIKMWQQEAELAGRVYHPCLPADYTEDIQYKNGSDVTATVQLIGSGAGHTECRGIIERVFKKDEVCELSPCSFSGVYQPPLTDTFKDRDLYVFSYFYDLTQPLGMPSEFSVRELGDLANHVCNGDQKKFQHVPNALTALTSKPDYCLDLTYIYSLLRFGYDIPSDRLIRTAKKIRGAETGWCLGAAIAMLDEVNICKS
ncbi:nucleoside phosphatase GDA1/CD39 [Pilobolus umbonatus]|nr:nucleoside phosphatase GDA1/CD39 [Pilobolus umbonatus]